jgi:N-acetylglutamate synthase-like GNAT family acetyltransferase
MSATIRKAEEKDKDRLGGFASTSGVSADDIRERYDIFYIMEDEEGQYMATVALERWERDGILRMLVINPKKCGMEDIVEFLHKMVAVARQREIQSLYLVTPSPEIFRPFGFADADAEQVPEPFREKTDSNKDAVVMCRQF